jgi:sec-independent protein translocase protein TatB
MFDIGSLEILVIALLTLMVMGPERLPDILRTMGLWIGRFKRILSKAHDELDIQVGMDEVRRQLHNEHIMRELQEDDQPVSSVDAKPTNTDEKPGSGSI